MGIFCQIPEPKPGFFIVHFPSQIFLHKLLPKTNWLGDFKNVPRVHEGDALFKIRTAKVGDVTSWFLVCF